MLTKLPLGSKSAPSRSTKQSMGRSGQTTSCSTSSLRGSPLTCQGWPASPTQLDTDNLTTEEVKRSNRDANLTLMMATRLFSQICLVSWSFSLPPRPLPPPPLQKNNLTTGCVSGGDFFPLWCVHYILLEHTLKTWLPFTISVNAGFKYVYCHSCCQCKSTGDDLLTVIKCQYSALVLEKKKKRQVVLLITTRSEFLL